MNNFERDGVCNPVPNVSEMFELRTTFNRHKTFRTGQHAPSGCRMHGVSCCKQFGKEWRSRVRGASRPISELNHTENFDPRDGVCNSVPNVFTMSELSGN